MTDNVIIDQLYSWRQALEHVDLCAEDSRQRLNELYTEIVNTLREELRATSFTAAAPSLNQNGAAEAANPEAKIERLWELASHHPGEVVNNPIWSLILLSGKGLIGKNECIDEEQLFPFAQVEGFWLDVHRHHKKDWYSKLLLSYTALLPLEKHPFREHPLIKSLYEAGDVLSAVDLKSLEIQTDGIASYSESVMLQPIQNSLNSLDDSRLPLPGNLDRSVIDEVLLALAPVFAEGDELIDLIFMNLFGPIPLGSYQAVFLDASPIADLLLALPKTKLVDRRVRINDNTLYPAEVYDRLARHRNSGPQAQVAGCIHTPAEVFEQLAHSTSKEIIYPLACNPMTPIPVLHHLMRWSGWGAKTVKRYVQANPAYTGGEAWQLIEKGRLQLETDQRKKDVLLACLQLLSSQPDPLDGIRLLLNASIWNCTRLEPSTFRLKMIQMGWASEELMLAASWSWHWLERLAVAMSPLAPATALTKMQSDGLAFIRHAASQPRHSMAEAASAASPSGWIGQLATLATDDPLACVRHPRFADWLNQEPDRVASLLGPHHKRIQAADDLPAEYFCWRISQLSEREQLRLLMQKHVPQQALDQLVLYDTENKKPSSKVPEKRQGDLADLVASTAASHEQQSNPDLLRCAKAELEKGGWEHLSPQEGAFFIMGFFRPADVSLLNTTDIIELLLHPHASNELRLHLCQEIEKRGDDLTRFRTRHLSGRILRNACHRYVFGNSQEHDLNILRTAGQLLAMEGATETLRSKLALLIGDLAADVFGTHKKSEWLEVHTEIWPAVLCARETGKLVSDGNSEKRLLGACFGDLSEAQIEELANDSCDEVRYALALLRPCTPKVLEKLSLDSNSLVNKAALQNENCPQSTLNAAKGFSPLRNASLTEETARNLLSGPARKEHLKRAGEILCWTPPLMQEVLDSLAAKELKSFIWEIRWSVYNVFAKHPYSPELLSWMALLPVQSDNTLYELRELAASHPATPASVLEQLVHTSAEDLVYSVASNPSCSTDLHRAIQKIGITGNPINMVSSPNYPVDWLASHASNQDPNVRAAVALHPNCPLDLLIKLLSENTKISTYGPFEHRTVAEVASTSLAIVSVNDPASHATAALALLRSTKPSSRARRLALRSPNCPSKLLSRCASSLDWRERHAVASHPTTPTRVLNKLTHDANQYVAYAAKNRLNQD